MHLDLYSVVSPERTSSATQLYSTTQVWFLDMGRITLPFPLALEVGPLPSLCLALPVAVVNVRVVCLSVRLSVVRRGGSERQSGLSVRLSVCLSGRWFDVAVVNVRVVCLSVCPSVCLVGGSPWR